MKRVLVFLTLLATLGTLKATQFWYDSVSEYTNNPIWTQTSNSFPASWFWHLPGSSNVHDLAAVTNSYTSGAAKNAELMRVNGQNQEYLMRLFDPVATNTYSGGFLYASFIANANFVP